MTSPVSVQDPRESGGRDREAVLAEALMEAHNALASVVATTAIEGEQTRKLVKRAMERSRAVIDDNPIAESIGIMHLSLRQIADRSQTKRLDQARANAQSALDVYGYLTRPEPVR